MSRALDALLRLIPAPAPLPTALLDPRQTQPGETVREKRDRLKLLQETWWVRPFDRGQVERMKAEGWEARITLWRSRADAEPVEVGLGRFKP